CSAFAGTNVLF
nr:immunoglobulin light chain junction region [Macaca mulatta]